MKSDRKTLLIIAAVAIIVILCAVAMGQQEDKPHGYDDLSTEMKAEVDFLLSKSAEWEKYVGNIKTIQCTEVSFPRSDSGKVLYTFYFNDANWAVNSYYGWRVWYSYDPVSGTFHQKDKEYASYTFYDTGKSSSHTYKEKWSTRWDTSTKRDYLANQLWSARNSSN